MHPKGLLRIFCWHSLLCDLGLCYFSWGFLLFFSISFIFSSIYVSTPWVSIPCYFRRSSFYFFFISPFFIDTSSVHILYQCLYCPCLLLIPSLSTSSTNTFTLSIDPSFSTSPDTIVPLFDPPMLLMDDLYLSIALCKGTYSYTWHLISHFVSYDCFHLTFHTSIISMASKLISQSHVKVLQALVWKATMDLEIRALVSWSI